MYLKNVGTFNQGSWTRFILPPWLNKVSNKLVPQNLRELWILKVCKDATIKTQMLSGFDPAENETVSMKTWQTEMQIQQKWTKVLTRLTSGAWKCAQNSMHYVPKLHQVQADTFNCIEKLIYLCQRLWSHILTTAFAQVNMNLNSQKNLTLS